MPTAFPQTVWDSLNEGVGKIDTDLGGRLYTFLAAPLAPTAATVEVDTTLGWPSSGKISVGGELIAYASKTATSFAAVSRAPAAVQQPHGAIVYDQSAIRSEVESARSQVVLPTATGQYLKNLLANHGLPVPGGFTDAQLRAYGQYCSHVAAGPLRAVFGGLDAVLAGPMFTGTVPSATTVTLGVGQVWPAIRGRLIRILAPAKSAGVYRIRSIAGQTATLETAAGEFYDGAALTAETAAWEAMPFDLYEDPQLPGNFCVDVLKFQQFANVAGAAFLQGGEPRTSTDATHVTTLYPILQVLGVWLAGDVARTGTNYFTGGAFVGSTITLGVPLPAAQTAVLVDYGSVAYNAQLLIGPQTDGKTYYPFYLTDPAAFAGPVLSVVRAAGCLPVITQYQV